MLCAPSVFTMIAYITRKTASIALAACLVATAGAQQAFGVHGQYAQFRNMSGLPGGSFGVNQDGDPDMSGAMAISTPIAYSLRGGHYVAIGSNTSYDSRLRFPSKPKLKDFGVTSNGTASAMAGISTSIGDLTVGMNVVSGAFENCYNVLFTPNQPKGKFTLAVGAEGLFSAGGFIGPGFHSDADRAISAFGVGTFDLGKNIYVSGGWGTSRFAKGFANMSVGLGPRARVTVEHDGYGWNYGIGGEVAKVRMGHGRDIHVTAFLGKIQGRYAFWSLGIAF
ncbi:MAG TPA: hypothetical protein VHE55_18720 [Fimbriimonadaceae bacterium]|nr:hypothetical protein [Fimbriimonadaceae bacterium]